MSPGDPPLAGEQGGGLTHEAQSITKAIGEISDRATLLVHEEIELAKAEMSEKVAKIARGAVVGAAAGVFLLTALVLALVGCAWLLYFYLPIGNDFTYFYGFFAMAVILVILGVIAGLIAARVLKRSSPPMPNMAIEEARKIRESVGPGAPARAAAEPGAPSRAANAGGGS